MERLTAMETSELRLLLDHLENAMKWTVRKDWSKASLALESATAIVLDAYATKPERKDITGRRAGSSPSSLIDGYVGGCTWPFGAILCFDCESPYGKR